LSRLSAKVNSTKQSTSVVRVQEDNNEEEDEENDDKNDHKVTSGNSCECRKISIPYILKVDVKLFKLWKDLIYTVIQFRCEIIQIMERSYIHCYSSFQFHCLTSCLTMYLLDNSRL